MAHNKFKFFDHTADIEFQAYGKNIEEAFSNSVLAMFRVITEDKIKEIKTIKLKIKAKDLEGLLYTFLEELLVLLDSKNFLLSKIKRITINKEKTTLEADIVGDKAKNYQINMYIKSPTYNEMYVREDKIKKTWTCQVVLDV